MSVIPAKVFLAAVKLGRFLALNAKREEWHPLASVLHVALTLDRVHHTQFVEQDYPEYYKDCVRAWQALQADPPATQTAFTLLGQGVWGLLQSHPGEFAFGPAQEVWPHRPEIAPPQPAMSGPIEHLKLS
jgi:hypothetical protein